MSYEIQVTTRLPQPRYFIVDVGPRYTRTVTKRLSGYATEDHARAALAALIESEEAADTDSEATS